MKREQGWKKCKGQGAKGEIVKGARSKEPPKRASFLYCQEVTSI